MTESSVQPDPVWHASLVVLIVPADVLLQVEKYLEDIFAYCGKPVSLGYIEGTSLKARNIIRRAYRYLDEGCMKLKTVQGCSLFGVFQPWVRAVNSPL